VRSSPDTDTPPQLPLTPEETEEPVHELDEKLEQVKEEVEA
jgi:hypothetical protein